MIYSEIKNAILSFSNLYEDQNGIKTIDVIEHKKDNDIAIFLANKSDNTKTFFIVYKCSRKKDNWLFWTPTDNQLIFLKDVYSFYEALDTKNSCDRNSGGCN